MTERINIIIDEQGKERTIQVNEGDNIIQAKIEHDLNLVCSCEGSLACSTCHIILEENTFQKLPQATEQEEDLLDLAFGVTETSRLGCQVKFSKEMEGTKVVIPEDPME